MKSTLLPACLLAAAVAGAAQSADLTSEGKSWWAHVQFLADDKLEGRNVGTPGLDTAIEYVESQFRAIGQTIRRNGVRDVYHQPADDTKQTVNLEAAAMFNRVIMTLLQRVSNDTARPTWNADSFFRRFAGPR